MRPGLNWYALVAASIALVLLFAHSRSDDIEQHGRRIELLQTLRHLDARLDRDVLRVTSFTLLQYDPLVETAIRLQALAQQMQTAPDGFADIDDVGVRNALGGMLTAIDDKLRLLERIKSQAAVLRNEMQYLPVAIEEVAAADAALGSRLAHLLNRLHVYHLFPSLADADTLRTEFDQVEQQAAAGEHPQLIHSTMIHMQALLVGLETQNGLRERYIGIPGDTALDTLFSSYTRLHAARSVRAERINLGLLAVAAVLFALLGIVLHRLEHAQRQSDEG